MSEPLGTEVPEAGERRGRLGTNYWRLWTASVISNLGDGISLIAYPWLASAVTRNAILIALIAVAQRLPWLLFSLPAGVITALLCQGLSPLDAARLGTHVHGFAGDLAAEELGHAGLIASDLVRFLPSAFVRLAAG